MLFFPVKYEQVSVNILAVLSCRPFEKQGTNHANAVATCALQDSPFLLNSALPGIRHDVTAVLRHTDRALSLVSEVAGVRILFSYV